jgi:Cu-processing system permease protein
MTAHVVGIARSQVRDVIRSRWLAVYTGFFAVLAEGLLRFSGGDDRALLSVGTASLMVIPLATLLLTTIYVYNAREFIELVLAQPIKRAALYFALYLGLALPTALSFVVGTAIPFVLRGAGDATQQARLVAILAIGVALTLAFSGIAFCIALAVQDRLQAVGLALGVWLASAVLYDGVVLAIVALFSDYPIERPLLGLMFVNPVDLGRVLLLLRLDTMALLGYTGAVLERFFGVQGVLVASAFLAAWVVIPAFLGARLFRRKDF